MKTMGFKVECFFVCDCFSYNGAGTLQSFDGTMDKYQYINILANNIPTSSTKMMLTILFFSRMMIISMHQNMLRIILGEKTSKYWNGHLNHLI